MMNVWLAQNVHHSFKYFGNNLLQFCVPFSPKSDNFVTECLLLLLLFWLFHFMFFSQPIQNIHHGIHNTDLWNHLGEVVVQERTLTPLSVLFTGDNVQDTFLGYPPNFSDHVLDLVYPSSAQLPRVRSNNKVSELHLQALVKNISGEDPTNEVHVRKYT